MTILSELYWDHYLISLIWAGMSLPLALRPLAYCIRTGDAIGMAGIAGWALGLCVAPILFLVVRFAGGELTNVCLIGLATPGFGIIGAMLAGVAACCRFASFDTLG